MWKDPTTLHLVLPDLHESYLRSVGGLLGYLPRSALLFGSRSRFDSHAESDVDVLVIVESGSGSHHDGLLSVTCYTRWQLEEMVSSGSLFAWHLKTEGQVLVDSDRVFELLRSHPGVDPDRILARVRELCVVLDCNEDEIRSNGRRVAHVGGYLLRTAIYAHAQKRGHNSFNLDRAASSIKRPELAEVVRLRRSGEPRAAVSSIRQGLIELVGEIPANTMGSLAALAVTTLGPDRQLGALALQCLVECEEELDYANLPFPAL